MGREVRRVPPDWQHPREGDGNLQPIYDQTFVEAAAEWKAALAVYERKERAANGFEFWEWEGPPPDRKYYRPAWPEGAATHYQMYETTTEGTPISPVCASPEELAHWLADNGASAFADSTATYEQWLRVCRGGFAPSCMISARGIESGVAAGTPAATLRSVPKEEGQ